MVVGWAVTSRLERELKANRADREIRAARAHGNLAQLLSASSTTTPHLDTSSFCCTHGPNEAYQARGTTECSGA